MRTINLRPILASHAPKVSIIRIMNGVFCLFMVVVNTTSSRMYSIRVSRQNRIIRRCLY